MAALEEKITSDASTAGVAVTERREYGASVSTPERASEGEEDPHLSVQTILAIFVSPKPTDLTREPSQKAI